MPRIDRPLLARLVAVAVPSLVVATLVVWLLQEQLGLSNASAVYLLPVIATALVSGTFGAVASAVVGILLYDWFFTEPLHTFVIRDPAIWLSLVLLLVVALVVGELTALLHARAEVAGTRETEARELFRISRLLATRESTSEALPEIAGLLSMATAMDRIAITLGPDDAAEVEVADSSKRAGRTFRDVTPAARRSRSSLPHEILRRMPGDEPARWIRVHPPGRPHPDEPRPARYRVRIEAGETALGSIWAERRGGRRQPDRTTTRLLAAAADQVGQALQQDRLAGTARDAEVMRATDALRSALLQSVSHDLRTPLAAIRAAAGSLRPGSGLDAHDQQASAEAIEREVVRLDRLVANLLDMGRIEAGVLRAEREVFELDDLVAPIVARMAPRLSDREIRIEVRAEPVLVDPVYLDEILTNLLDNAGKFTEPGQSIRMSSVGPPHAGDPSGVAGFVKLTVEDAGLGVPDGELDRIFDKFYRVQDPIERARPGTGIGLAVVRGLAEAMGAGVHARRSALGGLAVDITLPAAQLPPELTASADTVPGLGMPA